MKRAAPSREAPSASQDLEAGAVLKLGEYADQPTLNTSEARIILKKTLDARRARNHNPDETETLAKTRDYLEIFAVFKEIEEAQQVESIIDTYAKDIARFEKSQLGEWNGARGYDEVDGKEKKWMLTALQGAWCRHVQMKRRR
jgi:hypothetical protein